MILYHASSQIIEQPDILHSREHLDFGKGFYLTHLKGQAENMHSVLFVEDKVLIFMNMNWI